MYSGSGTQVCANMPVSASGNHGPNGYPPYFCGSFGPPPSFHQPGSIPTGQYPTSYFPQPNSYQYQHQDFHSFGPVDTRFTQHSKDQALNVFQSSVTLPMPPMNMPPPFMQYNGQIPFPPPMQHHTHYSMLPPNGNMNHYPNPSSRHQVPSSRVSNENGKSFNGEKFHAFRSNDRNPRQEQSKSFHCGSCDRDFFNKNRYEEHIAEHIICGLDGCTFKAHPMIMEKHIAMQHRSGLYTRIVKGNSPEEIEKWVKDRKKHYPTLDKITEKQLQKAEMEKRGERYNDRRQSSNNRNKNLKDVRNRPQVSNGRKSFGNNTKNFNSRLDSISPGQNLTHKPSAMKNVPRKIVTDKFEFCRNLPAFRGTEYHLLSEAKDHQRDYSDSDFEEDNSSFNKIKERPEEVSAAESTFHSMCSLDLIRGYHSLDSSDDDYDESNTNLTKEQKQFPLNVDNDRGYCFKRLMHDPSTKRKQLSINEDDTDSGPEECSSKLPVPDFIRNDSPDLAYNKRVIGGMSSQPPISEIVDEDINKEKINSEPSKKSARKRTHRKNRNEKVEENSQAIKNQKEKVEENNQAIKNQNEKVEENNQAMENRERCQDDKKLQTVLPPPRKRYRRPSLLEKLLAPEIKRERNLILQCVRYVVNNNYFNIGSTSKASANNLQSS